MFVKKFIISAVLIILFSKVSFGAIENSIIPSMERFEILENLPCKRYSDNQYYEISKALKHKEEKIRLVSYNVLFNILDYELEKANRWKNRCPRVVELIESMDPDILCVQELYKSQLDDLLPYIGDKYTFYSKPCEDGELNGIFFRKERFKLIDWDVWYMTNKPDVPSAETLTMVKLKDLKTGQEFSVFNTHLAFSKINKRDFQARFIAEVIGSCEQDMPMLLAGDFNTFPNRLDLDKLPAFDGDYVNRILTQGPLKDSKDLSLLGHLGPTSTFTNAPDGPTAFRGHGTPGVFLDRIYVTKKVAVLMHAVEPAKVNGHFPSDHMPILIDFYISKK